MRPAASAWARSSVGGRRNLESTQAAPADEAASEGETYGQRHPGPPRRPVTGNRRSRRPHQPDGRREQFGNGWPIGRRWIPRESVTGNLLVSAHGFRHVVQQLRQRFKIQQQKAAAEQAWRFAVTRPCCWPQNGPPLPSLQCPISGCRRRAEVELRGRRAAARGATIKAAPHEAFAGQVELRYTGFTPQ